MPSSVGTHFNYTAKKKYVWNKSCDADPDGGIEGSRDEEVLREELEAPDALGVPLEHVQRLSRLDVPHTYRLVRAAARHPLLVERHRQHTVDTQGRCWFALSRCRVGFFLVAVLLFFTTAVLLLIGILVLQLIFILFLLWLNELFFTSFFTPYSICSNISIDEFTMLRPEQN